MIPFRSQRPDALFDRIKMVGKVGATTLRDGNRQHINDHEVSNTGSHRRKLVGVFFDINMNRQVGGVTDRSILRGQTNDYGAMFLRQFNRVHKIQSAAALRNSNDNVFIPESDG